MASSPTVDGQQMTAAASIHINNLSKKFDSPEGGTNLVFDDVNIDIEAGSFVTLVGKSGSGKSTLLNILSGVLDPTEGSITFGDGRPTAAIGHVFQEPRLLPWKTALENIAYVQEFNEEYTDEMGKSYLEMVGLGDNVNQYPTRLSGGQKQRVGIARALSIDPEILLMDEPFSDLDEITAAELRRELIDVWEQLGKTVFFVTHNITEAIELSDRILMIGKGGVYGDISIDLERPRKMDEDAFLIKRQKVFDQFYSIYDEEYAV